MTSHCRHVRFRQQKSGKQLLALSISQFDSLQTFDAAFRLSVMVLRNSHPDATRFSAALSMIEIFRSGLTMCQTNQAAAPSLLRC
jgi:hypothetical protein